MEVIFLLDMDSKSRNISSERLVERFDEVKEAKFLAGSYDGYLKSEVEDPKHLERVHKNLCDISWIRDIETNIILPNSL